MTELIWSVALVQTSRLFDFKHDSNGLKWPQKPDSQCKSAARFLSRSDCCGLHPFCYFTYWICFNIVMYTQAQPTEQSVHHLVLLFIIFIHFLWALILFSVSSFTACCCSQSPVISYSVSFGSFLPQPLFCFSNNAALRSGAHTASPAHSAVRALSPLSLWCCRTLYSGCVELQSRPDC